MMRRVMTRLPAARVVSRARLYSSSSSSSSSTSPETAESASHIVVQHKEGGMASVVLSNPPVNTISKSVADEFIATLRELEDDVTVRGFVLGSAVPGVFSAGIHLPEMLMGSDGSTDGLANYWTSMQEMWLALYTTRLATVAAIPGHCIAGGCMLAWACDHRVMVEGKGTIGLNETKFGLVPPLWLSRMLVDLVGPRMAERMATRGEMISAEEACRLGVVDSVVQLSRLADEAQAQLAELLSVNDTARGSTKQMLRADAAEALRKHQDEDLDWFVTLVSTPEVQSAIATYLESLSNKKSS